MTTKYLVIFLVIAIELCFVLSGPAVKSNYIEQENSCREVCGLCECDGFYCEDECICECSIKDEDNLQCIADMKTECDKNGLEYELLMQEETKERFLRQIKPNMLPFEQLSKNLVIIKKKREDPAPVEESKISPASVETDLQEDPKVGSPGPSSSIFSNLPSLPHIDIPNIHLPERIDFSRLSQLEPSTLVVSLRDRLGAVPFTPITMPTTTTTQRSFTLPSLPSLQSLPTLPPLPSFSRVSSSLSLPHINLNNDRLIVQPAYLQ